MLIEDRLRAYVKKRSSRKGTLKSEQACFAATSPE